VRFSNTAKNLMLDALDEGIATGAKFGSLHTAYSSTGTNEVTGGSPAYARKGATWAAAASGAKATSASMVFDVPAGTTVRWVGFWDAVTVGNFLGMTPNGGGTPQDFVANAADVTSNTLDCVAHGYSNGDQVVVWAVPGDPLPTGLAEGTVYFVVGATTDTVQLSTTSGGSAIDITAIGAGLLQKIVPEVFGAQGTHTVTTATMTLD
jgi:hypothetical protein